MLTKLVFQGSFTFVIKDYYLTNNDDNQTVYKFEVTYEDKAWEVNISYEELELFHSLIIKKHINIPFFPPRNIIRLTKSEIIERNKHFEEYFSTISENKEIYNSLEFRLLFKVEDNLKIYLNPPEFIKNINFNDNNVIDFEYIEESRAIICALDNENNKTTINKIFSSFTNLFRSNSNTNDSPKGILALLSEKDNKSYLYSIVHKVELKNELSHFNFIKEKNIVILGYKNGVIELFVIDLYGLKIETMISYNYHKNKVIDTVLIPNKNILISTGKDNLILLTKINSHDALKIEEKIVAYTVNCLYLFANNFLITGDEKGSLVIYKLVYEDEGVLALYKNYNIIGSEINKIIVNKAANYLFIVADDINAYEIDANFYSSPKWVNSYHVYDIIHKVRYVESLKCFIISHSNGLISFVDIIKKENTYCFNMNSYTTNNKVISSFYLSDSKNMLITGGFDNNIKFWRLNDYFNSDTRPKNRVLETFEQLKEENINIVEHIDDEPLIVNNNNNDVTAEDNKETLEGNNEDDDLLGWDS